MVKSELTTDQLNLFTTQRCCCDCGKVLTGHGPSVRCPKCAPIHVRLQKFGKRADILIFNCIVCNKECQDYASNRKRSKHNIRLCSPKCRAIWVGVHNSIRRGGDGLKRTKSEKDKIHYRKNALKIRIQVRDRYTRERGIILEKLRTKDKVTKLEIVEAYGGECVCCGEKHFEFLTIDHINGDGAEHRRQLGGDHRAVYRDIKRRHFPKDQFRLLCLNCNLALGMYGYCPHNPETMRQTFDKRAKTNAGRPRTVD